MSKRENSDRNRTVPTDMESETRWLMEEAMSRITPDSTTDPIDNVEETADKIDDTFQRMQAIIDEFSSAIGDAINSIEPNLDAGLLEIEGDKVRPRSLSELVSDVNESEVQMLEDARAVSYDSESEPLDSKDLVMPTPEYLGPEDGKEYEQEGR